MKEESPTSRVRLGRNSLYESINCSKIRILTFIKFPEAWGWKCKSRNDQDTVSDQSSGENNFAQQVIVCSWRKPGVVTCLWLCLAIGTIIFLEFILSGLSFPLWNTWHFHVLGRIMREKGRQVLEDEWIWYPNSRVMMLLSHIPTSSPQSCFTEKQVETIKHTNLENSTYTQLKD